MNGQLQQLKQAARNLLDRIDISTDCMSNQIKRENIDESIGELDAAIKQADGNDSGGPGWSGLDRVPPSPVYDDFMKNSHG